MIGSEYIRSNRSLPAICKKNIFLKDLKWDVYLLTDFAGREMTPKQYLIRDLFVQESAYTVFEIKREQ